MHRFVLVHEKYWKVTMLRFVVIALVLHTDTQREHQLLASSTKSGFKNLNHTYTKVSQ